VDLDHGVEKLSEYVAGLAAGVESSVNAPTPSIVVTRVVTTWSNW